MPTAVKVSAGSGWAAGTVVVSATAIVAIVESPGQAMASLPLVAFCASGQTGLRKADIRRDQENSALRRLGRGVQSPPANHRQGSTDMATDPQEIPFEEPAGEPPPEPNPFSEPTPVETPSRPAEPQPGPCTPECPPEPDRGS